MHSNTGNEAISNFFWSQNIGPVHLISISTEFYYFPKWYGALQLDNQFRWLEADLEKANRPENRARQPWIIVGGHRPFYVNTYIDRKLQTAFEELFWRTGVDIYMAGHEHIFDLSYPVYREQVKGKSFANPAATIYIISGSAGCIANISEFSAWPPPYTAKVSGEYGFSSMTVINATTIHFQQINHEQVWSVLLFLFSKLILSLIFRRFLRWCTTCTSPKRSTAPTTESTYSYYFFLQSYFQFINCFQVWLCLMAKQSTKQHWHLQTC